jgi:DNA-directed RNA polymerase subunit H (RpoH/RPB5)
MRQTYHAGSLQLPEIRVIDPVVKKTAKKIRHVKHGTAFVNKYVKQWRRSLEMLYII